MYNNYPNDTPRPEDTIRHLWRNWALACGALTLPLLLSLWIPKVFISILTLAEAWFLISFVKSDNRRIIGRCTLIFRIVARILFVTSLIMLCIVILCTDWLVPTVIHLEVYNTEIPFITSLIIFPVTVIFCVVWLLAGRNDNHCRECQRRYGAYAGDSIVATLYFREARYQIVIMLILALSLGSAEYWYYFFRYINSDLNTPDRFFFNYMPVVAYFISLLFMGARYANMQIIYNSLSATLPNKRNKTAVRFLVFCADDILLHHNNDGLFDTPFETLTERTASIGDQKVGLLFEEMSGISKFELRYCFTNEGMANGSNIIHYAAFISESERNTAGENNVWFNAYMIDNALAENALSPVLANEIYRIHTITMAWKTYDRNGKRLYPIRHYRPTFRFSDLPEWNVDYDDLSWLNIAQNNEDKHFFRLRRFFDNITGAKRKRKVTDAQ